MSLYALPAPLRNFSRKFLRGFHPVRAKFAGAPVAEPRSDSGHDPYRRYRDREGMIRPEVGIGSTPRDHHIVWLQYSVGIIRMRALHRGTVLGQPQPTLDILAMLERASTQKPEFVFAK